MPTSVSASVTRTPAAPRADISSHVPLLREGASGEAVSSLQRSLARAGFDPGSVDGRFGPRTERAVRALQASEGLEVDGVVGPRTHAALARPVDPPVAPPRDGMDAPGSVPAAPTVSGRARTGSVAGVSTWSVPGRGGVAFKAGMSVDADGSPRAYNPSNTGLDALANAGRPGNWWGLATDGRGKPYVQGPNDPAPGHYVSTTALVDPRFAASDPRRYVDSEKVPFIAVPPQLRAQGVKLGDLVAVRNERTGKTAFALVADIGPGDHLGEGSIALARQLGVNPNARAGGAGSGVSYVVFPGSGTGRPLDNDSIQARGRRLYAAWGGDAQLATTTR